MCHAFTIRRFHRSGQALPLSGAIPARLVLLLAVVGTTAALGQNNLTDTANNQLMVVFAAGALTPANNNSTLTSGQVQFLVRCQDSTGYHVNAIATFTPGAGATVDGGDTMAAKDIGIGIASVMTSSSVLIPRADTVLTGFKYDPAAVTAVDGLTPYTNAAGGRATLADLATSKRLLAGPKIANSAATSGGASGSNYLLVTLSLGALPQYFSPSNFSFQLTLTVAAGP